MLCFPITVHPDPSEILIAYVTAPDSEAPALARAVVERRLAACVNILPKVRSIYVWEGAVQDEAESLMMIKTTRTRFEALRSAIVALHSYAVPEVIAVPVAAAHAPYSAWVAERVAEKDPA